MYDSFGDGWNGSTFTVSNTSNGTVYSTGTLAMGFYGTESFCFDPCAAFVLSAAVTDVSCNGGSDGSIDISGVTGATYSWDNGATTEAISGLSAGTYTLNAWDAYGCADSITVTVAEPSVISLSAVVGNESAAGAYDGHIDLTVSGGTPCITNASVACPLLGGNGQSGNAFNLINTSSGNLDITGFSQGPLFPNAGGNGTIEVYMTPGSYTNAPVWTLVGSGGVTLTPGAATGYVPVSGVSIPAGGTIGIWIGLTSGTVQYTNGLGTPGVTPWGFDANLTVTEGHGGTYPNGLQFSPRNWNGTVHYGDPNATAYTFAWSTGDTTEDIGSLLAGGYCVTVTDCNGCTASFCDSVGISLEPGCTDPLAINYSSTANVDDGSCIYMILGCADSTAFNYNPLANTPDPNDPCCYQSGCMDPFATNYDAGACWDDSTLCTYPTANVSPFCDDFESGSSATYGWLLAQQTYASVMVWGNGATFVVNGHPGANGPINGNYSLKFEGGDAPTGWTQYSSCNYHL
jgi:hypothetical protein